MDVSEQLANADSSKSLVHHGQIESAPVSAKIRPRVSVQVEVLAIQLVDFEEKVDNYGEDVIVQSIKQQLLVCRCRGT